MDLRRPGTWAGAVVVAVAVISGCGSSKSTTAAAAQKTTTTSSSATTDKTTDKSGGSSDDTSAGAAGALGLTSEQCANAATAYSEILTVPGALMTGSAKKTPSQIQAEIDKLKVDIPDKLKADYTTVAQAYAKYANDLNGVDFSKATSLLNPETLSKLQSAGKDLDSSDFKNASDRISKYFSDSCK
jgi:hypothetical protein